jgi:cellulose synthase/poly-beta-1,6-N-acetylglucosamine synthase-like glycosyltransferase
VLRSLALIAQAVLLALAGYNAVTALWGWPDRAPAAKGRRERNLRVVIPAHNEEKVIAGILGDLSRADYPRDHVETWVIADRCSDRTEAIAVGFEASVATRDQGPAGKGACLAWYLAQHSLRPDESLVVFDADNRVGPEVLGRISDELDAGHEAVQCYLDAANPDGSPLAEASALSYWAGNRMVQLARSNLGWSADFGGTGMAISAALLEQVGGFAGSLTEDQDLGARIVLAGHRVEWLHDVKVHDEKPTDLGVTVRQRARWMSGRRASRRRYLGELVRAGEPEALDYALRLIQPGRTFVALVSGVLTAVAAATGHSWLIPWQIWATATSVQVFEPIPFLARDGVPTRRLLRYPLLILLAALWLPIRLFSGRVSDWYHTPHGESS